MAITLIKAEVVLPDVDGLPRDEVVNTLAWQAADTTGMTPAIADLFNGSSGAQAHPLAHYIGGSRSRVSDACTVRYYDISAHADGSKTGPAFQVDTWTLGAGAGGTPLPDQNAAVASFFANPIIGAGSAASYRGRVYLGPLDQSTGATDSNGHFIIAPTFAADVAIAFNRFMTTAPPTWSVWSRKETALSAVVGGFINEQFDTQRRRQVKAAARAMWP